MIKINTHILEAFVDMNKMSAFRLYMWIKNRKNNHLHREDFDLICEELHISIPTIRKCLGQLNDLGICRKFSKGYWRFDSWKTHFPINKNRIVDISIDNLSDIKFLRTLYYSLKYKSAWHCAKKNSMKTEPDKRLRSSGFYDVSASFVKAVTGITRTDQTLLKHLKRSVTYGLNNVRSKWNVFYKDSDLSKVILAHQHLDNPTVIKKFNNFYYLIQYYSNKIQPIL